MVLSSSIFIYGGITDNGWSNDLLQIKFNSSQPSSKPKNDTRNIHSIHLNDLNNNKNSIGINNNNNDGNERMEDDTEIGLQLKCNQLLSTNSQLTEDLNLLQKRNIKLEANINALIAQLIANNIKPIVKKVIFNTEEIVYCDLDLGENSVPSRGLPLGIGRILNKSIQPITDNENKLKIRAISAEERERRLMRRGIPDNLLSETLVDLQHLRNSRNESAERKIYH